MDELTEVQRSVAELVGRGMSKPDIAAAMNLSMQTIGHHLYEIYSKLGIHSRTSLAVYMLTGWLPPTAHKHKRKPGFHSRPDLFQRLDMEEKEMQANG